MLHRTFTNPQRIPPRKGTSLTSYSTNKEVFETTRRAA